ncbi:MAG: response regulator receiver modulated CheB methylesterase [Hyphomicrobiales bacterium]|nr:response regulator receiver modulated CheB methylesterase [Hyphomicrobiales bacterium]
MSSKRTRVLIVDDSATMQQVLREILSRDPQIEVVGEAFDPHQARAAIKELNPDVITLDVEMPNMNGLDFLERLMRLRPMPVIMVSSLTSRGAETTIRALELGAFDCVAKPRLNDRSAIDDLRRKVKMAAGSLERYRLPAPAAPARRAPLAGNPGDDRIIAVGASTGGVEALICLLGSFPEDCPPTVITQHMPALFTKPFAARLDRLCAPRVAEAHHGAPIERGCVYVAPGGKAHLTVRGKPGALRCHLVESDTVNGHRPSVDVLFNSVTQSVGGRSAGIILTGMGRDGASGLDGMRKAGALTFGQSEDTCVVYGMPKVAFEIGAVAKQVPLQNMAAELFTALRDTR